MRSQLVLVFLLFSTAELRAWGRTGHMIVGAIAYRQLSRQEKELSSGILRQHEEYSNWKRDYEQLTVKLPLGEYVFMRASVWPDQIRRNGHRYHHEQWHNIYYPLRPPDFVFEPAANPKDNVVYGLGRIGEILSDPASSQIEKAAYLSWAVHLIGDIHQPLHCANLIDLRFPEGDRVGTEFYVRSGSKTVHLHRVWDTLLGTDMDAGKARDEATRLLKRFPRPDLDELQGEETPQAWSLEGRQLAIQVVYREGKLGGVPGGSAAEAPELPRDYTGEARKIAERRVALAGYRLARWLTAQRERIQ